MAPMQTAVPTPRRLGILVVAVLVAHGWTLGGWLSTPETTVTTQPPSVGLSAQPPQLRTLDRSTSTTPRTAEPGDPAAHSPTTRPEAVNLVHSHQNKPLPLSKENKSATKKEPILPHPATRPSTEPDGNQAASPGMATHAAAPNATGLTESASEPQPARAVAPAGSAPMVLPGSATLRYDVTAQRKGLNVQASATLELQMEPSRYSARMTLKAWLAGSRIQTSRGTLTPGLGFVPERFGDQNRSKPEQAAHFDRTRQPPVVRFSANAPDAELLPGTQDRLSVLLQLAALLEGRASHAPQKPVVAGEVFRIHTAGTDGAAWWVFHVLEKTTLDLPAGPTEALHLRRDLAHPHDNQVELWMAPAMGHLPVRIWWQQANGDVVDQKLTALTHP